MDPFFKNTYTNEREDFNLHHHMIFVGEICGVGLLFNLNYKGVLWHYNIIIFQVIITNLHQT